MVDGKHNGDGCLIKTGRVVCRPYRIGTSFEGCSAYKGVGRCKAAGYSSELGSGLEFTVEADRGEAKVLPIKE